MLYALPWRDHLRWRHLSAFRIDGCPLRYEDVAVRPRPWHRLQGFGVRTRQRRRSRAAVRRGPIRRLQRGSLVRIRIPRGVRPRERAGGRMRHRRRHRLQPPVLVQRHRNVHVRPGQLLPLTHGGALWPISRRGVPLRRGAWGVLLHLSGGHGRACFVFTGSSRTVDRARARGWAFRARASHSPPGCRR